MISSRLLLWLLLAPLVRESDGGQVVRPLTPKVPPHLTTQRRFWSGGARSPERRRYLEKTRSTAGESVDAGSEHTKQLPPSAAGATATRRSEDAEARRLEEVCPPFLRGVAATAGSCGDSTQIPLPSPPTRAPRVFLGGENLHVGQIIQLTPEQTRYLVSVMRLRDGSPVRVFDGVNGEFLAAVFRSSGRSYGEKSGETSASRRSEKKSRQKRSLGGVEVMELRVEYLTRWQPGFGSGGKGQDTGAPEIELIFAPIRKQRLKILVEKAVEIGASRLTPVLTVHTQKGAISDANALRKLGIITATEAAEQCERMTVPPVADPVTLASFLRDVEHRHVSCTSFSGHDIVEGEGQRDDDRSLIDTVFVCKERDVNAPPLLNALDEYSRTLSEKGMGDRLDSSDGGRKKNAAFLVGPEGGFDADELSALAKYPFVRFVSLGPTVLRSETAAMYALSIWSAFWAARR